MIPTDDDEDPRPFALPDPVQWHEGMLLAPQHFQIEAWRIEALMNAQLRAVVPHAWGVARLAIDRSALIGGVFRVAAVEALMADGLALSHPAPGDPPLELDLAGLEHDFAAGPAAIHLKVARRSGRAAAKGERRRYRSVDGPPAPDENTGEDAVAAPRLRAAVELTATAGPLVGAGGGFVSTPLALVGLADGRFALQDYQPPLLRATRGQPVHDVATRILAALRERVAALAERARAAAAAGRDDAESLAQAARALVPPAPRLEALVRDETASPYALYLALCDVLGAAAAVDLSTAPPSPPRYRHADALPAFRDLEAAILPALDRLRSGLRLIALRAEGDGAFLLDPPPATYGPVLRLVLHPRAGVGADALAAWAEGAVIATAEQADRARATRVRGAPRRALASLAELGVAAPPGALALEVEAAAAFVSPGAPLAVRGPHGPAGATGPGGVSYVAGDDPA
jgi:type VI secretion system protein ImpJ